YRYDANQFALANNTNLAIKTAAALTNVVLYNSGVGPALGFVMGAGINVSNGTVNFRSNSIVNVGVGTGTGAQLRFGSGSVASDYTGTESWNFKTAVGGGRDTYTVARINDLTNGFAIATQDGSGTNTTLYATINT